MTDRVDGDTEALKRDVSLGRSFVGDRCLEFRLGARVAPGLKVWFIQLTFVWAGI